MIDADQALHHAEVFADQLQTRGDARGELLSLELAAHRASTSAEARRLHREAQRIRDAHEALVWPAPLRDSYVQMRAGFVLRGGCDELFAADVPIELAVSVRETWTTQRRLEEVLPGLIEARRRGLALDQLRHVSPPRAAASLAQLPTLAAHEGRRLAIRALQLDGPVERFEALGQLLGLKRFCRDQPVDAEQLRTLAKLGLESLHIRTQQLDPAVLALLGPSLQTLDLHGFTGSLAPILALPRLRSLTLDHTPTPGRHCQLGYARAARVARHPLARRPGPDRSPASDPLAGPGRPLGRRRAATRARQPARSRVLQLQPADR